MNIKDECRQLVIETRPIIDKLESVLVQLESPVTATVCDKLRKQLDKFMELSINMPTGSQHE
ncbi:unnamed protein product [marine sediment metagenome]|uniref:Uncharacterized protein n=1 Tax=marine sediment metagenome TaxID=412755 RepID=X1D389_9ZZZZ